MIIRIQAILILVLRAQIRAGGHFVWNITMKYFSNPSHNKPILHASDYFTSFLLIGIRTNKLFLTLLVLKKNRNVSNKNAHDTIGVTVIL